MNMKKFSCFLSAIVISSFMLSSKNVAEGRLRVKRSGRSSKNINSAGDEDQMTTVANEIDLCEVEDEESPGSGQTIRSTTTEAFEEKIDLSILSPEFLNCSHVSIEPGCYQKFHNGSVFVPHYNQLYDKANYIISHGLLLVCPLYFFNEHTLNVKVSLPTGIVSIVCMIISSSFIILYIIMFCFVKSVRNLQGYILLSLSTALTNVYVCFFVQHFLPLPLDCPVIGMFILYFFLASFFWINAMSYDVWRSIRMATAKLRLTDDRPIMIRYARYCLYAWGIPLLIIISSIIVHYTSSNIKYRLFFNVYTCWFEYQQAFTVYFAIPLFLILGMNIIFFVSSFYMISQASIRNSQSVTQSGSELRSRLFLSLALSSVMGFMWISGIIAHIAEMVWLLYLFSGSNALHGVFIFFSFTTSETALKAFMKAIHGCKLPVSPTQTSSQQTSSHHIQSQ